jgi:TatD DNase family protein
VPESQIFLETDSMEESIEEVYALAANYRRQEVRELTIKIQRNVAKVFGV